MTACSESPSNKLKQLCSILSPYVYAKWDEGVLLCGDCLEIMPKMPPESVDMVFADPPFNVGKAYQDERPDYYDWCGKWIEELFRLLGSKGTFYLMTITLHLYQMMSSMKQHGVFIDQVIWPNSSLNGPQDQFVKMYQVILQYGKSHDYIFNPRAQIIYRKHTVRLSQLKKKPHLATGYPGRVGNIWDDIKFIPGGCMAPREAILEEDSKRKAHPCQMPIALAERAVVFSTEEGAVVLDPFAGIATTGVGCIRSGRRFVLIELEENYCKLGKKRIDQSLSQPLLLRG